MKRKKYKTHKNNCQCCICNAMNGGHKSINNPFYGKHHSSEIIRNISLHSKGKKKSKSHCKNISKGRIGIEFSPSHKKHLTEARRIQWQDPIYKNKVKLTHYKNWHNKEFREKHIQRILKAIRKKPTKPEKVMIAFLDKYFPKTFKYVGNNKFIINGFNPDFINCNGKKEIIEIFGSYWHNREDAKIRDKERLQTYIKYGYKTLIIWDTELKDLNNIKEKVNNFVKKDHIST